LPYGRRFQASQKREIAMVKVAPEQRSMPDINPEKVCFVVEKAREWLGQQDGSVARIAPDDDASDTMAGGLQRELVEFIDDLDADEKDALVALVWIGRGDVEPEDWRGAVDAARDRGEPSVSSYLLEMALLPDYLEDALGSFGCSCRDFGSPA
jgi:hypothetical protein